MGAREHEATSYGMKLRGSQLMEEGAQKMGGPTSYRMKLVIFELLVCGQSA